MQYLGAADAGALKQWRHIDDEILSIQALGSGVATTSISLALLLHLSIRYTRTRLVLQLQKLCVSLP